MQSKNDKKILRDLASEWYEIANLEQMNKRKKQWKAVKDLNSNNPMILVETISIHNYVREKELKCEDPFLRNVEKRMKWVIRHFNEIGDDIVIEPYFKLAWEIKRSNYGVQLEQYSVKASDGTEIGTSYNSPIKTAKDINKLKICKNYVDRDKTIRYKNILEDIMGDILPIIIGGYDPWNNTSGYKPWTGNYLFGLTLELIKLIGNENLLLWGYDEPDALHKIMSFLRDDRLSYFMWMEKEGLLDYNADNSHIGPGSYGYVTALPNAKDSNNNISLKELWGWAESQETESISPSMFAEFFLPYIADLCSKFGLIYYGCCEHLHDRWELISSAIPNVRAVSVSPWSNLEKMGEMLGKDYVYSRKPNPVYISNKEPNWNLLKKDIINTIKAAKQCNLEILLRGVYTINDDRARLKKWVDMVKSIVFNY